ncbi:DUF6221 family protein [Streptomyces sp. A-14]|uniref:DUF6221 family protein n=1 Tax=Streptomyces sp. A-14 TaxID=3127467 RepID=UPI003EBA82BF
MTDLADFLRARFAERRAIADTIHDLGCGEIRYDGNCTCGQPALLLVDLDAKLALLDEHGQASLPNGIDLDECRVCGGSNEVWPCPTLRILARPFTGHTGYLEEWAA